jgi:hypothetical protein
MAASTFGPSPVTATFQSRTVTLLAGAISHTTQLRVRAVYPGNAAAGPQGAVWAVDSVTLAVVPRTQLAGFALVSAYPTCGPSDGTRSLTVEFGVRHRASPCVTVRHRA